MKTRMIRFGVVTLGGTIIAHFGFGIGFGWPLFVGNMLGALIVEILVWGWTQWKQGRQSASA